MTKKDIGKFCRDYRGGVSKYKMAKLSGLTIGQIDRIESGNDNYTVDVLNKYLGALKLKIGVIGCYNSQPD